MYLTIYEIPQNLAALWSRGFHYDDVIMGAMASQITSRTIVYSIVYSGTDQRKHQSYASLAFVQRIHGTGEFPAQRARNAENVPIWWRHHVQGHSVLLKRRSWVIHVVPKAMKASYTLKWQHSIDSTLHTFHTNNAHQNISMIMGNK